MMNKRTFTGYVFAIGLSIGLVITSVALGNSNLAFRAAMTSGESFSYTVDRSQVATGASKRVFTNGSGVTTGTLDFTAAQTGKGFSLAKRINLNFLTTSDANYSLARISFSGVNFGGKAWGITWYDGSDWTTAQSFTPVTGTLADKTDYSADGAGFDALSFSFAVTDADLTFDAITITFVCN